jgi:transglutaminase-like putative cysteine protease
VRQGLAAAAPALWLLGVILLYSSGGRYLLLAGLALTLALHILLEQGVLTQRWQLLNLDYSPGLLVDRFITVLSAGAVVLTLAAVMPNLYIEPLVNRYYAMLAPTHLAMEEFAERLFPELRGTSRLRGGDGSGMPNDFLLRGGPNLGSEVVMRVRTDEAAVYQYQYPYYETAPPPGHYMRARTLTVYDGRGWSNAANLALEEIVANQRWAAEPQWGRKQVVQSVILETNSNVLLAAPEPVEASAGVRLEKRAEGDLVAVQARESSYTVVSMVPAVSEEQLRGLPSWSMAGEAATTGMPTLSNDFAVHLEIPASVTERTRTLAAELVEGQTTAYDKALVIEQYLRQYVYDLEVSEPPNDVTDVADYFLFELQRGYCDYYATAFVVLARLAGLPARFATGFTSGQWNPVDGQFIISENNAHSWPEVYFPEVGWIPFEPTAGRSPLLRIALPQGRSSSLPPPVVTPDSVTRVDATWNWQPLVWLVPLALFLWIGWQGWRWWWRQREDPWQAVLQWGSRAGRPIDVGETVLEYGQGLAGYVLRHQVNTPDAGRIAAREIEAVSAAVNRMRYGGEPERREAQSLLDAHWRRLRDYLRVVRIR